jgi:hypothetical protein
MGDPEHEKLLADVKAAQEDVRARIALQQRSAGDAKALRDELNQLEEALAELEASRGEPPARFEVGRVLRRSLDTVRSRWLELLVLTYALGWAPVHLIPFVVHDPYRIGSHNLAAFAQLAALSVGYGLIPQFASATIIAATLRNSAHSPGSSVVQVFRALPVLVPIWLVGEIDTAWRLWNSWTGALRTLIPNPNQLFELLMSVSLVEMAVGVAAAAAVGVLYPVVIEEGRDLLASVSRAWRLMRGARWKFVGLLALYALATGILGLAEPVLLDTHASGATATSARWAIGVAFSALGALWYVVIAVSYLELREAHDRPQHDQTAHMFA